MARASCSSSRSAISSKTGKSWSFASRSSAIALGSAALAGSPAAFLVSAFAIGLGLGGRTDRRAACRPSRARRDSRARRRRGDERPNDRHYGGAAGRQFHRLDDLLARGVRSVRSADGRARSRLVAHPACPPAHGARELRRADRLHGATGRGDTDFVSSRVLSIVPIRRLQPVLDDDAAPARRPRLSPDPARHRAVRAGRRFRRDRRADRGPARR